jgi:hypothetical protein
MCGFLQIVKEEGIDCKFQRMDGYLFDNDNGRKSNERLDKELAAATRLGFDVE